MGERTQFYFFGVEFKTGTMMVEELSIITRCIAAVLLMTKHVVM